MKLSVWHTLFIKIKKNRYQHTCASMPFIKIMGNRYQQTCASMTFIKINGNRYQLTFATITASKSRRTFTTKTLNFIMTCAVIFTRIGFAEIYIWNGEKNWFIEPSIHDSYYRCLPEARAIKKIQYPRSHVCTRLI